MFPRLVADPRGRSRSSSHDVVEHHEVGDEDLVHPAPGLEAVQVVLGRLATRCAATRSPGSRLAGWMRSPSASSTAVTGCWASQSISRSGLQRGAARARSRRRAGRGRGRSGTTRRARAGAGCVPRVHVGARAAAAGADEVAQQPVHPDRIAGVRAVAGALERRPARRPVMPRERRAAARAGTIWSSVAVDHEHRAARRARPARRTGRGSEPAERRPACRPASPRRSRAPQPTQSSICLVECGSLNICAEEERRGSPR